MLSRAEVWRHAGDVFTLLWHALAWGAGRHLRQNKRRLTAIAADVERAGALLTKAAELSRTDPKGAFAVLRPGRANAIKSLGRRSSRSSCTSPVAAIRRIRA